MTFSLDTLSGSFAWVVHSSARACLLIAFILIVRAALRHRLAPRWRSALWLLLVVQLALPWSPESRLSIYNLFPAGRAWAADTVSRASPEEAGAPAPAPGCR